MTHIIEAQVIANYVDRPYLTIREVLRAVFAASLDTEMWARPSQCGIQTAGQPKRGSSEGSLSAVPGAVGHWRPHAPPARSARSSGLQPCGTKELA